uniref:Uncharacterized protein n=1 Tax=Rousettus aegyptiacus TaxID=9407 RepID=A0A7J8CHP6_ROUAE|nr:hypothetical protein HJG63_008922 [Rousettus aegyptiacus]
MPGHEVTSRTLGLLFPCRYWKGSGWTVRFPSTRPHGNQEQDRDASARRRGLVRLAGACSGAPQARLRRGGLEGPSLRTLDFAQGEGVAGGADPMDVPGLREGGHDGADGDGCRDLRAPPRPDASCRRIYRGWGPLALSLGPHTYKRQVKGESTRETPQCLAQSAHSENTSYCSQGSY